jgi:hypothetical protein
MFSLHQFTKVKILDVTILSQKNRAPDANPGVRLAVQADLPNHVLTHFDGALRTALFTKAEPTAVSDKDRRQTLPGVDAISDLPNLTSLARHVRKLSWDEQLLGYRCEIDHGLGGKSNLQLDDAQLDRFRFSPKQGGTALTWWNIEFTDVPKLITAELCMLKSREIPIMLREPEVTQQEIEKDPNEGAVWPFPKTDEQKAREAVAAAKPKLKPGSKAAKAAAKSATEEFLGQHGTAAA